MKTWRAHLRRRHVQRGDIITVISAGVVHRAKVKKGGKEIRCVYTDHVFRHVSGFLETVGQANRTFHVHRRDEGKTWAPGTEGPEVDALWVVHALR